MHASPAPRRAAAGVLGRVASVASGESSAMRASPMSRSRFFGSRSRQRRSSERIAGGVDDGSADQSISWRRTAASVSLTVSPSKSRLPLSISKSTTPKAQTSARLSTARPRACSGDM